MRAVCQRVTRASARVSGGTVGEIVPGMCVLLGVARGDGEAQAVRLAAKIARLRIFGDEEEHFARSLLDRGGAALVVSQFTLLVDSSCPA
jgi:D-tyrosyl-tRNA(Tyr) deacylase